MNDAALSLIDVDRVELRATVLLDDLDRGAANPWGVAWSEAGTVLGIAHSGTHELSLIDWPGLDRKVGTGRRGWIDDLSFLDNLRRRVALTGNGPRALVACGERFYAASYFSDQVEVVDGRSEGGNLSAVVLGPGSGEASAANLGNWPVAVMLAVLTMKGGSTSV
jgi:hypothetical protein